MKLIAGENGLTWSWVNEVGSQKMIHGNVRNKKMTFMNAPDEGTE